MTVGVSPRAMIDEIMNEISRAREILFNSSLEDMDANRHLIPYCVRWMPGDRALFLNRDYLPLGVKPSEDYCEYEDYPTIPSCAIPGLTSADYSHYLFDDAHRPWTGHIEAHDVLKQVDAIADNYALLYVEEKGNA